MILDLSLEKLKVWAQPGMWGERLTVRSSVNRLMNGLSVGDSVTIEKALSMTGQYVSLEVVKSYVYQKKKGKVFSASLRKDTPLIITRIA